MVMSAYRLVTHSAPSLSGALPYVNFVNYPVKWTGAFPLNPLNNGDFSIETDSDESEYND